VGYAQMAPRLDAGIVGGLRLRIATLNAFTNPITPAPVGEPEPVWRHTFGAERRAAAVRRPLRFKPDIVLLHGVMTVASARQLFPARHYHLRVSRQILQQPERAGAPRAATTAIAIRRDAGLRV